MGHDRLHTKVIREFAEVLTGPFSIIFEKSWRLRKDSDN